MIARSSVADFISFDTVGFFSVDRLMDVVWSAWTFSLFPVGLSQAFLSIGLENDPTST